jgi:hypothetical protein
MAKILIGRKQWIHNSVRDKAMLFAINLCASDVCSVISNLFLWQLLTCRYHVLGLKVAWPRSFDISIFIGIVGFAWSVRSGDFAFIDWSQSYLIVVFVHHFVDGLLWVSHSLALKLPSIVDVSHIQEVLCFCENSLNNFSLNLGFINEPARTGEPHAECFLSGGPVDVLNQYICTKTLIESLTNLGISAGTSCVTGS